MKLWPEYGQEIIKVVVEGCRDIALNDSVKGLLEKSKLPYQA